MGKLAKLGKAAKALSQGEWPDSLQPNMTGAQGGGRPPSASAPSNGQGKMPNVGALAQQLMQGVNQAMAPWTNNGAPGNQSSTQGGMPDADQALQMYYQQALSPAQSNYVAPGYQQPMQSSMSDNDQLLQNYYQQAMAAQAQSNCAAPGFNPPTQGGMADPMQMLQTVYQQATGQVQWPPGQNAQSQAYGHMAGAAGPSTPAPASASASTPVGNAADFLQTPKPPAEKPTLIPMDVLEQLSTRPHSAKVGFGHLAVVEARKGLSRRINLSDRHDMERFAMQLRNSDAAACLEEAERSCDRSGDWSDAPIFALSYEHCNPAVGRFKFSAVQWGNLLAAADAIVKCGISVVHLWIDQCLWLRDASQECWAHTGLMPYTLYPVISLGTKRVGGQRTLTSYSRMWPFVEEVVALWSMGLIITRELRDRGDSGSSRQWLSFNCRERLQPEESFKLILLNIYHGAVDGLQTGWSADVDELREMAHWNFHYDTREVVVGSNWRMRLANNTVLSTTEIITKLKLTKAAKHIASVNTYLDGSRQVPNHKGWDGFREWRSGNDGGKSVHVMLENYFQSNIYKASVLTNVGEFQLLSEIQMNIAEFVSEVLWLLVAMEGRSSNFGRGRVSWTKVMHGEFTCSLGAALLKEDHNVVAACIGENLGTNVSVVSITNHSSTPIEWM